MQGFVRKNLVTILVLGATVLLAGIAVFTALRLYQLRQQSVSPAAPTSKPAAAEPSAAPVTNTCTLSFALAAATPTPTPTPTATPTPTPTPTPGAPNACGGTCGSDSNCTSGMTCYITSGTTGVCRNPSCTTSTNCVCATPTPTPIALATPTPTVVPTPAPQLPKAGVSTPTWIGIGAGAILLIGAVLLAL